MITNRKLVELVLPLVAALAVDLAAAAEPPGLVNYQGVLRDATDAPITASLDMIFHLYDTAAGGSEILVDRHLAGLTGDVAVTGGLFNVTLGSGTVEDGSGTGTYTTLADAFRDHTEVYLEVEIETPTGFETLAPRTRIVSAAYSLSAQRAASAANADQAVEADHAGEADHAADADHAEDAGHADTADQAGNAGLLDGVDSSALLRSDASDTFTTGTLTLSPGTLLDAQGLANVRSLRTTESLTALGGFRVGGSPLEGAFYSHFGFLGFPPNSGAIGSSADVFVENNVEIGNTLYLNGRLRLDDDGPDHDQFIYFYEAGSPTGVSIAWDDSADLFLVNETLRALSLETVADAISINPDGPDQLQSLFFYEDSSATGERLQWDNTNDRFYFSDDLWVAGTLDVQANLNVSGTKNFVQNHPWRRDLSVVYTALEGDEAGTFTRGFARLVAGEVRVPLGESFALVTNPDLGLTAHLTPRGGWSALYVDSLNTSEMVVRAAPGSPQDLEFDYVVMGLRIGYEDQPVFQSRTLDSPLPFERRVEGLAPSEAELQRSSALERYRGMSAAAGRAVPDSTPGALALRRGIGERDPRAETDGAEHERIEELPEIAAAADLDTGPPAREPAGARAPDAPAQTEFAAAALATRGGAAPAGSGALTITLSADVALEAGDVVVFDALSTGALRRAAREADPAVAGVVADTVHAVRDDGETERAGEAHEVTLVVGGLAKCKADAAYGAIRPGDLLATSPTPGHVMLATAASPGTIVGKALEPLTAGTGTIRVLVTLR